MNQPPTTHSCTIPLDERYVVFPDLAGAGLRHVVNFGPTGTVRPAQPGSPLSDLEEFCIGWFFREAGLNASHYRRDSLQRRIQGLLRALRARSVVEAWSAVRANRALLPVALDALLIGVTSFFRDAEVFATLADRVLPGQFRRCERVRIWSAGCSDGSELFSAAMLLAEQGLLHRCELLGTDCRAGALAAARSGLFKSASLAGLNEARRNKYFHPHDSHFRISAQISHSITWQLADVLGRLEPRQWNVIFCRNLTIYLQQNAATALWGRLRSALRPGGVLVAGSAERPAAVDGFRRIAPCIFQRGEE